MVVLSGLAVAAIGGLEAFAVLTVAWAALGLTRGLLRVASAALVMEEAGTSAAAGGAASGVYLSGLDLGRVLGPAAGGFGAHAIGIRPTFLLASVSFPVAYFVLAGLTAARTRRRQARSLHSLDRPA
jgi:MFS family permease